jgi:predicted aspartyl protease
MKGHVDSAGRALIRIGVKPSVTATAVEIDARVDTGFIGELVLPQEAMKPPIIAHLMETFICPCTLHCRTGVMLAARYGVGKS